MSEAAEMFAHKTTHGGWRVAGSRVSLDSVVVLFLEGKSADAIAAEFPALTLAQVHGAIAFYFDNRQEIDQYLSKQDAKWMELAAQSESKHGPLLERLRNSRPPGATERAS